MTRAWCCGCLQPYDMTAAELDAGDFVLREGRAGQTPVF